MGSVSLANEVMAPARGMRGHRPAVEPSASNDSMGRGAVAAAQQRSDRAFFTRAKSGRTRALWHNGLVGGRRPRSGGGQYFPIHVRTLRKTLLAPLERRIHEETEQGGVALCNPLLSHLRSPASAFLRRRWTTGSAAPACRGRTEPTNSAGAMACWTPATGLQGCDGVRPRPRRPHLRRRHLAPLRLRLPLRHPRRWSSRPRPARRSPSLPTPSSTSTRRPSSRKVAPSSTISSAR